MKGKGKLIKGECIPVKLFELPAQGEYKSASISPQGYFNKTTAFEPQNILKQTTKPLFARPKLIRSASSKSTIEKSLCYTNVENSFIDFCLEEPKEPKISNLSYTLGATILKKPWNIDEKIDFSLAVLKKHNSCSAFIPSIKKLSSPLKRSSKALDPLSDWLVFETFPASKPVQKAPIKKKLIIPKPIEAAKPKRKLQAFIPKPSRICMSSSKDPAD